MNPLPLVNDRVANVASPKVVAVVGRVNPVHRKQARVTASGILAFTITFHFVRNATTIAPLNISEIQNNVFIYSLFPKIATALFVLAEIRN